MNKERLSYIEGILQEMVDSRFVSGVNCLVLQGGEEQCYFEKGLRDLEAKAPMTRDTIFRLYSMTKPVTAAAVMKLIEDGKLDLLDPVEKFIPTFRDGIVVHGGVWEHANRSITIKDLLNMTSGITYGGENCLTEIRTEALLNEVKAKLGTPQEIGTVELAGRIGEIPRAFQPGQGWQYGLSADVLGAVVEVASGKRFGEFLQQNFFEPLAMQDTDFYVPEDKQQRFSKVYRQTAEGLILYTEDNLGAQNKMDHPPLYEAGGAGLVSTIDDYSHFTQMLLDGGSFGGRQILQPQTVEFMTKRMLTPKQQACLNWDTLEGHSYGNLMRVMTEPEQAPTIGAKGEYGWDGWLGAYMANDPVHNMTMLMMFQRVDSGTTGYTRKVKNVVFAAL